MLPVASISLQRFHPLIQYGLIAKIGTYSYSIYLTHFFYVSWMSDAFASHFRMDNFYFAIAGGAACFLIAATLAAFSYHVVEVPFLRLRRKYVITNVIRR